MEAKKCDLCGKFYEPYRLSQTTTIATSKTGVIKYKTTIENVYENYNTIDLCKDCLNKTLQSFCNNLY
jgi:hypothetical protein